MTITMITELSAEHLALSSVAATPLEILHRIEPDGQRTRLKLTFRWPAGLLNGRAVARSMADAARNRAHAFKNLIETRIGRGPPGSRRHDSPPTPPRTWPTARYQAVR